jgi:pyrroloquinoline-quinone synthase
MHLNALRRAVASQHLLQHPFYRRWTEGALAQSELQSYAAQYSRHVAAFPRYVSAVHSRCELPSVRASLLENLIEEERGSENHPELWMRFAEATGTTREAVAATEAMPQVKALTETFFGLCNRSWEEGLGALYAYESQVPEVAQAKIEGLQKFYGVTSARGLSFFKVHLEADVMHRGVAEAIFRDHVADAREEAVVQAATTAAKALWGFLDGMEAAAPAKA